MCGREHVIPAMGPAFTHPVTVLVKSKCGSVRHPGFCRERRNRTSGHPRFQQGSSLFVFEMHLDPRSRTERPGRFDQRAARAQIDDDERVPGAHSRLNAVGSRPLFPTPLTIANARHSVIHFSWLKS